jgi:large repetitive protein
MVTSHYIIRHVPAAILIAFLCASCSSETNKETIAEAPKITKSSIQKTQTTIKEVIAPPTLSLIDSPALNGNNLVSFGFSSSKAGTISYSGNCFSSTKNAIKGDHHILFVAMVEGHYDNCAIQVTDIAGNKSDPLQVPSFRVDFTSPKLSQVGEFRIDGRKVKVDLKSSESGKLTYSGNCIGDLQHVKQGKAKVTISFPGDGQYSDCEVFLSDASGNTSEPLPLGTVRIDTTPPVLSEIKPVPEKIHTDRPSYSFKTSKSGSLQFNGKCKGNVDKAVTGINHISLLTTEAGSYSDCTMTLTDSSNNRSQPLKISPFVVGAKS